jgi:hypothetical protein
MRRNWRKSPGTRMQKEDVLAHLGQQHGGVR